MEFIDLKTQYKTLQKSIDARIQRVLEHCQFILGPEVREMEEKLAAYTGSKHCIATLRGARQRLTRARANAAAATAANNPRDRSAGWACF